MDHIALTSNGPLSGKTTLAKALEVEGYEIASHSLTIANLFVEYLQSCCYPDMSLKELYDDKEFWRPGMQKFGADIGFDQGSPYVEMSLAQTKGALVVFDNVRTNAQALLIKQIGFTVVEVIIPEYVRQVRAGGVENYARVYQSMKSEVEQGISSSMIDLRVSGNQSPDMLAKKLKEQSLEQLRNVPYPFR